MTGTMGPTREWVNRRTGDVSEFRNLGAEEGTRTPTSLRIHGPEPCASANSATSAHATACRRRGQTLFISILAKGVRACQTGNLRREARLHGYPRTFLPCANRFPLRREVQ